MMGQGTIGRNGFSIRDLFGKEGLEGNKLRKMSKQLVIRRMGLVEVRLKGTRDWG